MTATARRLVILCGLLPTLVAAALCLYRPPSIAAIDWRVYDMLMRGAGTREPDDRIVIVDVDERSLTAVGQWPWRRDLIGRLISNLRDQGASAIALDIVFAEPDRFSAADVDPDAALADVLRDGRVVLGYALTFADDGGMPRECVHHPLGLAVVRRGSEDAAAPFFRARASVCNLPGLGQAAGASGFLNAAPDPDGILRRVPMLVEFEDRVYPALALAAVTAATGARGVALRVANLNASTLQLSRETQSGSTGRAAAGAHPDVNVPLDGKSNLLVRYRGPKRTFRYVSALDVLNKQLVSGALSGKLVFVGTSALGTREVVSTPLDTGFTGVEVQATVADNLLQQDFFHRPEHGLTLEALAVLVLGVMMAVLAARRGAVWGAAGLVSALAAAWITSIWLLGRHGIFVSPLFPTISLPAALAAMTGVQWAIERSRADRAGRDKATTERVMVQALLSLVEIRDAETGRHSRRTQQYTRVLAQELATHPDFSGYLTPERIELVSALAPLHDIGKVGVPDRLLNKAGMLTEEELIEMRKHPIHGRDVILKTEREVGVSDDLTLTIAKDIAYTHHERWDGTGYPQGLRGTDIPIAGRLIAVVDVYDAAHSRRVYHQPLQHAEIVSLILKGKGTHFDPAVVDGFVKVSPLLQQLAERHDQEL